MARGGCCELLVSGGFCCLDGDVSAHCLGGAIRPSPILGRNQGESAPPAAGAAGACERQSAAGLSTSPDTSAGAQLEATRISGTITLAPSVPSPALSGGPDDSDAQPAMDNAFWFLAGPRLPVERILRNRGPASHHHSWTPGRPWSVIDRGEPRARAGRSAWHIAGSAHQLLGQFDCADNVLGIAIGPD